MIRSLKLINNTWFDSFKACLSLFDKEHMSLGHLKISKASHDDLPDIVPLRPEGWGDLEPDIRFYLDAWFCELVKLEVNQVLVGIGAVIDLGRTKWLAHIIVGEPFRNQGLGYRIVDHLMQGLTLAPEGPVLLIATQLGEPVYKKFGFRRVGQYLFFERKPPGQAQNTGQPNPFDPELSGSGLNIIDFTPQWKGRLFSLDEQICGEDRQLILDRYLPRAKLAVRDHILAGFYIPGFKGGPIIADDDAAGLALMELKYATVNSAVLPQENQSGRQFLIENGFKEVSRCSRMIKGDGIAWAPEKIYSRISGNFG
ncbi:MAG: GNAT family N-acetyltransferase [Desulfobacteraceae bacterium]|nr:MAG: GNAT family N-acetyltransferase [Desulfobacteraceae bacterium]